MWTVFTYNVTASGTSSTLQFRATGPSNGYGGYLDAVELSPVSNSPQAPPGPTGFGSVPVAPSGVRLSWNAAPTATSYRLFVNGPGVSFNQNVGNITSVQGVGLPNGTYSAQLFAVNQSGESLTPALHNFTIGRVPPGPVASPGLTITKVGTNVTVSWPAAPGASEHVLEVTTTAADTLSIPTPVTTLFAANVPSGTYQLRVFGRNACGAGPPTSAAFVTVP